MSLLDGLDGFNIVFMLSGGVGAHAVPNIGIIIAVASAAANEVVSNVMLAEMESGIFVQHNFSWILARNFQKMVHKKKKVCKSQTNRSRVRLVVQLV